MPITKDFLTIDDQITLLKSRNLKFRNEPRARDILKKYNYFDVINGFESILLSIKAPNKQYHDIYFEDFWDLFTFDMRLKEITLFRIFDIESRMRSAIAYNFSSIHCSQPGSTMNYIDPSFYLPPPSSDKFLTKKFNHFDLFKKTTYKADGVTIKDDSFIDKLKKEKPYVAKYNDPPFWVTIKALPLGTLYYTFLFLDNNVKNLVLKDFGFDPNQKKAFEQAIFALKEMRNECAHLELISRFSLKRQPKLMYFNDITSYAKLSSSALNYMDILKIIHIFCDVKKIKFLILGFYLKMCIKGRKKIAKKVLSKMGRKSLLEWMKI